MNELIPTSKISRSNPVDQRKANSPRDIPSKKEDEVIVDRVTLSQTPKTNPSTPRTEAGSTDIRKSLVSKFRRELESGSYSVKSNEIAEKMIQKIREDKDLPKP